MVKFDKHISRKTGETKTQVRVTTEERRPDGKYSKVTVRDFGYLEDHPDRESFLEMVRRFDDEYKHGKKIFLELAAESCFSKKNSSYNFGYRFLESIYNFLEIDEFFDSQQTKTTYDLKDVFKYDVMMRILCPGSKRATIQLKDSLYSEEYDFRLHQNYRSLEYYAAWKDTLLRHINEVVKRKIGRESEYALYDCTNYYFERDIPQGLAQPGVSKEHRTSPIVQMGLFIDSNALPICFSMFSGNTTDGYTLKPVMSEVHKNYGLNRIIVVGDKGFNSKENMTQIINDNNGFVFSTKLRGTGKSAPKYQKYCFETDGWTGDEHFKYMYFNDTIELKGLNCTDKKVPVNVLIYYKEEIARMEKAKRKVKIDKARKYIEENPGIAKLSSLKKSGSYIQEVNVIDETGEVADTCVLSLDEEKIKEEEKLDGYFCLITTETGYDWKQLMSAYSQLWMIEESFRITKNDMDARPVFVSKDEHIVGYFVETFVALLIIRLLQYAMKDDRLSAGRIIEALNSCNCNKITEDIIHVERIGGRNAFFYRKNEHSEKTESTMKLVTDLIEDSSENAEGYEGQIADQIQSDFCRILKTFHISEPNMWMKKKDFDSYLDTIRFSTISPEKAKKRGRPRKAR